MRPKLKLCEMINDGNLTSAIGPICQNALGGGSTAFCRLNSISVFELFILGCFMNSNLDLVVPLTTPSTASQAVVLMKGWECI